MTVKCLRLCLSLFVMGTVLAGVAVYAVENDAEAETRTIQTAGEDKPTRSSSVSRFLEAFDSLGFDTSGIAVGFATSMEKILPRDLPFELTVAESIELGLARNEKESF